MTNYGISIQVMPCISSRIHIIIGIRCIVYATSSITHHADDDCCLVDVVTRKCTYTSYFAKIIEQRPETCLHHRRQLRQPTTIINKGINKPKNQSINQSTQHIPLPQHHHLLLIMFLTLSSVHAALKKFLEEEFECAICLETCTDTLINPECNHRFCGQCIKESLHKCNHECPTCRVPIPTYRTCRRDPHYDHIVSKPK
jgi:hypothetical protein